MKGKMRGLSIIARCRDLVSVMFGLQRGSRCGLSTSGSTSILFNMSRWWFDLRLVIAGHELVYCWDRQGSIHGKEVSALCVQVEDRAWVCEFNSVIGLGALG